MTALVGACVATTVLAVLAVVEVLRRHGSVLRRLHRLAPQEQATVPSRPASAQPEEL